MEKDAGIFNEISLNDKIKVTVNVYGQKMIFEGGYQGIKDEKLSLKNADQPDPINFPMSEINEIVIIEKSETKNENSGELDSYSESSDELDSQDKELSPDFYKYISFDSPDFMGYCVTGDLENNERKINIEHIYSVDEISIKHLAVIYNHFNTLEIIEPFNLFLKRGFGDCLSGFEYDAIEFENLYSKEHISNVIRHFINFEFVSPVIIPHLSNDPLRICNNFEKDSQDVINEAQNEIIDDIYEFVYYFSKAKFFLREVIRVTTDKTKDCLQNNIEKLYKCFVDNLLLSVSTLLEIFQLSCRCFNINDNVVKICNFDDYAGFDHFVFILNIVGYYYVCNDLERSCFEYEFLYSESRRYYNMEYHIKYFSRIYKSLRANDGYDKSLFFNFYPILNNEYGTIAADFIVLFYYLRQEDSGLNFFIRITNDGYREKVNQVIKCKYGIDSSPEEAIFQLYDSFQKYCSRMRRDLYLLNGNFYLDKIDYREINELAADFLNLIKSYGSRYLFLTKEYLDRLIEYMSRLVLITDSGASNFSKAEKSFLLSYESCLNLIAPPQKEPAAGDVRNFLMKSNTITHTKDFSAYFYSLFVPDISLRIVKEQISINSDLRTAYIPFEIANSQYGQPVYITEFEIMNTAGGGVDDDPVMHTAVNPGSSLYSIAEIELDDTANNVHDIQLTFNITFRYKISYDFEKNEPVYGSKTVTEYSDFVFDENYDCGFKEIKNIFRDYCSGSVVKNEKMFFGRERDINAVIKNIRDENNRIISNRCVCIYGQTRTGKSSLLYHIKMKLQEDANNIIVDIGDVGSAGCSQECFCYRILSVLMSELEDNEELAFLMLNAGIALDVDTDRLRSDEYYFINTIEKIQRVLKRSSPDSQIIILIDEFTYIYDWIKQKKISDNFMKFWKALLTNYDISAIIIGQDHMMKFINDARFTNAFGVIRTWEVNYLSKPDAYNLITKPVSSSPDYAGSNGCTILKEAVEYLIELTSGSAYLLMNICAGFIDYLNERHALIATRGHAEDFIRRSLAHFEERWFEPLFNDKIELDSVESINANKDLLKKIALNSTVSDGVFPEDLNFSEKETSKLQDLIERKVVERKNSKISIIVKLYAEWLRNKYGTR